MGGFLPELIARRIAQRRNSLGWRITDPETLAPDNPDLGQPPLDYRGEDYTGLGTDEAGSRDIFQSYPEPQPSEVEQRLSQRAQAAPPAFQEPVLSKRRQVLGSLATVFGGRGGLGRLGARTLNEPLDKAERAYTTERLRREDELKGLATASGLEERQRAERYKVFSGERRAALEEPLFRARTENQISQVGKNEAEQARLLRPRTSFVTTKEGVQGVMDTDPTHPFRIGAPPEKQFAPPGPRAVNPGQGIYEGGRMRIAPNADVFNRARKTAAGGGTKSEAQRRIFETQHIQRRNVLQDKWHKDKARLKEDNLGRPYPKWERDDKAIDQEYKGLLSQEDQDYKTLSETLGYTGPEEEQAQGMEAEDRDSEEGGTTASEGDIVENNDGEMFTVRGGKLVPYGR